MDQDTFFAIQAKLEDDDTEDEELLRTGDRKRRRDRKDEDALEFFEAIRSGYPEQYEKAYRLAGDARALRVNDDTARIRQKATTNSVRTNVPSIDLDKAPLRITRSTAASLAVMGNPTSSTSTLTPMVDRVASEPFTMSARAINSAHTAQEDAFGPRNTRSRSEVPLAESLSDPEPDSALIPRRSPRLSRQQAKASTSETLRKSIPGEKQVTVEKSFSQATKVIENFAKDVTPTEKQGQSDELEGISKHRSTSRKRQRSPSPRLRLQSHRKSPILKPALKPHASEPVSLKPCEQQLQPRLTRASTEVSKNRLDIVRPSRHYKEKRKKPAQIFEGCVVLFLPVQEYTRLEKSPRRIGAYERGATIVKKLTESVTHVVVDDDTRDDRGIVVPWTYSKVKQALGISAAGDLRTTLTLVDLWYFPDCGKFGKLVPPGEGCRTDGNSRCGYRIPGHREWLQKKAVREVSERSSAKLYCEVNEEDFAHTFEADSPPQKSPNRCGLTPPSEIADSQPSPTKMPAEVRNEQEATALNRFNVDHGMSPAPSRLETGQEGLDPRIPRIDDGFKLVPKKKKTLVDTKDPLSRKGWTLWQDRTYGRNGRHYVPLDFDLSSPIEATPEKPSPSKYSHLYDQESPSRDFSSPGTLHRRDALTEAIEETSKGSGAHELCDDEDSQDSRDHRSAKRRLQVSGSSAWQQSFACMHGGKAGISREGPNASVIAKLQDMADFYERTKEPWKGPAYRKAIAALRREDNAVTTKAQAQKLSGVGSRLAGKIEEISSTNNLRFLQVYGAGLSVAHDWIAQGFRTLEDLRTKAQLTRNQQIGVEHYDDFIARIPREEVLHHEALVKTALAEISDQLEVSVGGSYRRGAATCGDVDFLITSKTNSMSQDALQIAVFENLIPRLEAEGYVKASLAISSREGGSKWHGAAALPGDAVWRRVDFLLVPWGEWGAALLYFHQ